MVVSIKASFVARPSSLKSRTIRLIAALLSDRLALGLWPAFAVDELFRVAGVPDAVGSLPPPAVMAAVLVTVVPGAKLADALKQVPELRNLAQEESVKPVIEAALQLEGMVRQSGTHAAGVVIADRDLTDYLPLTRDDTGAVMTQFSMGAVGDIGLLKMDFLGLKTLTVIQDCLLLVEKTTGKKMTP